MPARRPYPSDLNDARWELIEPALSAWRFERRGRALDYGRPPERDLRDVMDAILYVDRTGDQWRCLPYDFPHFLWNPACQAAPKILLFDMCWPTGSRAGETQVL